MDKKLHIAIIGAGMGGLTCALALAKKGFLNIDVYETSSGLGFVGAGIQLAPNMARILDRLGCWADVEREAVDLKTTSIRKGESDSELGNVDLRYIREIYGYPHMVGHRSSLAGSLYKACQKESAIKFFFSTGLEKVNVFAPRPSITLKPRNRAPFNIEPDVVIAADGVKSVVRSDMLQELGIDAQVVDTNQAAYRIMLNRSQMENDPELLELIDSDNVTRWIGEKRHIIAYPVSNKTIYNMSSIQPDTNFAATPSATYTTRGSKESMLSIFSDFCPKIQRLLNLVPEGDVCEWKLRVHSPLPTWVYGSVALMGDACHPTLPHLAQGAALAIEDAAVMAEVLSRAPDGDPQTINKCLLVYEQLRKSRAERLVDLAAENGRGLHLGDGAAKEERDRQFAALKTKKGAVPDKWADADIQKMIYGHDCMKVAGESFDRLFADLKF